MSSAARQATGSACCPVSNAIVDAFERSPDVAIGLLTGNFEVIAAMKLGHYGLDRRFTFGGYGDDHFEPARPASRWRSSARAMSASTRPPRVWSSSATRRSTSTARTPTAPLAVAVATGNYSAAALRGGGRGCHRGDARRRGYRRANPYGVPSEIDRRIAVEEVVRPETERVPHGRHDGQVFGACEVVHAEIDPHHDVLVADRAIPFTPREQSVISATRHHVLAGGVALGRRRTRSPRRRAAGTARAGRASPPDPS